MTSKHVMTLMLLCCGILAAQPQTTATNSTEKNDAAAAESELDISADRMEILLDGKTIELTENVRFDDEAMVLTANRMMIYLQDEEQATPDKAINTADQNSMKLKQIDAFGNVVLRKKQDATESVMGDKATYSVKTDTVTLTGNCVVTQGGHVMRGKLVTFDRLKQKINVKQAVITIKLPKSKTKGSGLDGFMQKR